MSDSGYENFNFSCTSCGACCSTTPRLSFFDLLNLSDEFIFQTKHYAVVSSAKDPLPKARILHLEQLAHTVAIEQKDIPGISMFYWMSLGAVQKPSQKTCTKLVDNLCSIHSKRPISCRNMPSSINYPVSMQDNVIRFYKNNTSFKCGFSEDSPEYWKDGLFADEVVEDNFYNEMNQIRTLTDRFVAYVNQTPGALDNHFKNMLKATFSKTDMLTDLIVPMCVMVMESWASSEQMEQVLRNQIVLLEREIEISTKLKIKDDVKTVRFFKQLIETYQKALKNDLFHNIGGAEITFFS